MPVALIIVDPQNDFCQEGSLAVPDSNSIFPIVNMIKNLPMFSHVYLTADNHPQNHISFASRHQLPPYTTITLPNNEEQELWPDHCVSGTRGQKFSEMLEINENDIVIRKGENSEQDSYSGFEVKENGQNQLRRSLMGNGITQVYVCGLSFDFCVGSTALDACLYGFKTSVITTASRSVSEQGAKKMEKKLEEAGINLISHENLT